MSRVIPVLMILGGLGSLFTIAIVCLSFTAILRIGIPISMKFLPKNTEMQAVVEVPFAMTATAIVRRAVSKREPGTLAGGDIDWQMTMDPEQIEEVDPAVYIEEHNSFSEVQRVVMKPGPLNYGSIASWIIALGCLPTMFLGLLLRITAYSSDDNDADSDGGSSVVGKMDDDD